MTLTLEKTRLRTLLGDYPNTMALKKAEVTSNIVNFDFADVKVANTAFKPLVREARFDVGELAIVTYLQARDHGKPYVLIPATVLGRGQHHTIVYNPQRGALSAHDLAGKRIGVRAYTQTTGVWVRGFLSDDYGVELAGVRWVTFEDPHVAEFKDPDFVVRAPEGKALAQMLIDGEIDAGIVGDKSPDPRLAPLVPEANTAAETWAKTHGGVPINHMMVVREVYRVLRESRRAAPPPEGGSGDPWRFGVEANRRSLEIIISYSFRQKLISRMFSVDELFDDCTRALG